MKVLLTGVNGQLGKTIALLKPNKFELIPISRKELDLEDSKECFNLVIRHKPEWIINTAAYTAVDLAEKQVEKAYQINYEAPKQFAKALSTYGGKILHISTDFVFDGNKKKPYLPNDKINPINVYGKSKAAGEAAIQEILKDSNQFKIIRTSWLMSNYGRNFALTILKLINEKKNLSVVNNQFGSPTNCSSLAEVCWKVINFKLNGNFSYLPNLMHWSNLGEASWYDVATYIFNTAKKFDLDLCCEKIIPINTEDYKFEALRPKYSVLDSSLTSEILNIRNQKWQNIVKSIIKEYINANN